MDQYPYSIPPGYSYAANAPEKNVNMPDGTTAVPGQNPYYLNSGPTGGAASFGYGTAAPSQMQQQQQQQIFQPNTVPIPVGQVNGQMPSMAPGMPVAFNPYGNQMPFQPALPIGGASPILPPNETMRMYDQQHSYNQPGIVSQCGLAPPQSLHLMPPDVAAITPAEQPSSNVLAATVPPEDTLGNVGPVPNPAGETNILPPQSAETPDTEVPPSTSSGDYQKSSECSQADSAANTPSNASDEPPPASTVSADDTNEPPVAEDLPSINEEATVAAAEEATVTEEPTDASQDTNFPTKSRSPTPPPTSKFDEPTRSFFTTSAKKKRRRIVTLNDDEDSDDENASNRLELLRSPEPPAEEGNADNAPSAVVSDVVGRGTKRGNGEGSEASDKEDDDRPGSAASGAASIFQNVVMIPAGDSEAHKRKKIRVLDSDDDDEEQHVADTVDDIGLTGEGADELNPGGLLVDENAEDTDFGTCDGIELQNVEEIVAMDAPIIDPSEMTNEQDEDGGTEKGENEKEAGEDAGLEKGENEKAVSEDGGSEKGDNEKEASDREQDGSGAEEEQEEEELGEEEEVVEEGVEMIAAEDDDGEAIGIATDDEQILGDDDQQEAESGSEQEYDDRGSDEEVHRTSEEERSEEERSEAEAEPEAEEESDRDQEQEQQEESESEKEDDRQEEEENQNDQSEARSPSPPVDQEKDSQESTEKEKQNDEDDKKSDSEDDVVCQNDLELNTISLLTDEEDDNPTPLPPPKKELPVVRIVNIKKELLDERLFRKEPTVRMDAATSYQQQHYLKKQQQLAQKKREKEKKRKERPFDNNDPFGPWSSSSSEDEFIPNDIYFGTPDRVFTASTKIRCQRQKMFNERYAKHVKSQGKPNKRRYGGTTDAAEQRKQKQKIEEISRLNLPTYQQQQLQTLVKKKKKRKCDRFYDKSLDIPNDIYFGNVNVPLHILYAVGDSSSDDERRDRRAGNIWNAPPASSSRGGVKYQTSSKTYKNASYRKSPAGPSSDRSVQAMKEYLKIAGFKNVKFHKLWEGCKNNQERANAILRLMQEKGLEGEPTIAKCRELRKQLQMEREVQVLDTSLIIDSGEGRATRRSARNLQQMSPGDPNAPSTSGLSQPPVVPPESLETLNRMRNVVDPDSDGDE